MLKIDREILFKGLKPLFGRDLSMSQRDGVGRIVSAFDKYGDDDPRKLAYIIGTVYLETFGLMTPVIETQTPRDKVRPSVESAIARLESSWKKPRFHKMVSKPYWRKDADGLSWLGRGPTQNTHKFNYETAEKLTGIKFSKDPDLMFDPEYCYEVSVVMMMKGKYTGKPLSQFFTKTETNWEEARRTVNGMNEAAKIATYAKTAHSAILVAMPSTDLQVERAATPPEAPPPPITQSKIAQAAGGVSIGAAIEVVKNTTQYINETSAQVNTIAVQANGSLESVQQTVTTVRTTAGSFSSIVAQVTSPPVMIVVGLVILVLAGVIVYKRLKMKEHYGV